MTSSQEYEAINRIGRVLYTSSDLDLAKKWVKKNADLHEGLKVREVVTTVSHRVVYSPRLSLVGAA